MQYIACHQCQDESEAEDELNHSYQIEMGWIVQQPDREVQLSFDGIHVKAAAAAKCK
jgi:hypothetical protein